MKAPLVATKDFEILRVSCPLCLVGHHDVTMTKKGDGTGSAEFQIADIKTPVRCVTCRRYFKLQPALTLRGVPMEGQGG